MIKIANGIDDLIGRTPVVRLNRYSEYNRLSNPIYIKLEGVNPAGSIKDRVALALIKQAETEGRLGEGNTLIVEAVQGNIGISLAAIAASRSYKFIAVMPDDAPKERRTLIKYYGAQVVLTSAKQGLNGAIAKVNEIKKNYPHAFIPSLYKNSANPNIHKATTAEEIWKAFDGKIDIVVGGVGSGGTLTGIGEALKKKNKDMVIVAVEPENSPMLSADRSGKHNIEGLCPGIISDVLKTELIDEVVAVSEANAVGTSKAIASCEGLLVGISAGAAVYAATLVARLPDNTEKNIVVIAPDSAERYLSDGYIGESVAYIVP